MEELGKYNDVGITKLEVLTLPIEGLSNWIYFYGSRPSLGFGWKPIKLEFISID